jgi:hypothetical protein
MLASPSPTEPQLCPFGTYFAGGAIDVAAASTCQRCPFGTTKQQQGSTSVVQCQVPPGKRRKCRLCCLPGTVYGTLSAVHQFV